MSDFQKQRNKEKIEITKELLEELYLIQKNTMNEVANYIGICLRTLRKYFRKFNIKARGNPNPPPSINPKTGRGYAYNSLRVDCFICKKEFDRAPSQLKDAENPVCSRKCVAKLRSINNSGKNNGRFNNKACQVTQKCDNCSTVFRRYLNPQQRKNVHNFCDYECYLEWISKNRVDYIGSYGPTWTLAKNIIRKRDLNCLMCGKTEEENGKRLPVHHFIKLRYFGISNSDKANHPSNLGCYCNSCHPKIEDFNEIIYTKEFLNSINFIENFPSIRDYNASFHCYSIYK